jgi:undecaprenyl-diphosphatase
MSLDLWLFKLINGLAGHTPVLDQVMRALVTDFIVPTFQVLGLLGLWFEGKAIPERRGNQRTVLRAMVALLVASGLVKLSNLIYFRERPFRWHEINLLFYFPSDSSFPSNSATVVFAVAAAVWLRNRSWGRPMLLLAAAFAFSRVYTGVHYPGDVLGGFALGAATAWALTEHGKWLDPVYDRIIKLARRLYLA